ncbi:hypothetical protein [uncultured Mailhella sp.]|uniref:hypothetical protein n=1 Tax=uncultured Mailhella sp. TaxID=1981031 RepID=UPI0025CFDAD9|nr:hypothetical protein [uncultured Mailhella sp.]
MMGFFDNLLKVPGRTFARAFLNSEKAMTLANAHLSDFLHIHSIVCREDMSLMVCFSITGMEQEITVAISDYSAAEDGSWICVGKAGSTVAGIDRALAAFVQGRRIPVPEKYAGKVAMLKKFLL